jgi:energy-coupling factor transporter ATP-binding protein EcfA2
MSKFIERTTKIVRDNYTDFVIEAFYIQNSDETSIKIPMVPMGQLPKDWNIGVIYGGSGTGKTTLLREFGDLADANFNYEKALISNFDFLPEEEACKLLTSMGLSTVPAWLRPFHTLSNGEQYRAMLAYKVGKAQPGDMILIDEYTSVVDRDVAKAMSNALQKYIRRTGKQIILGSCHFDIMEWLKPDWTYSPQKGRLEIATLARQSRPKIKLQIVRCRLATWNIFKQHHYLTGDINKSAKCFMALYDGKPVCFNAVLPLPSGLLKNAFKMTRTVVLPDFHGLGIGTAMSDYIGSLYVASGKRFYHKSSNPALTYHMNSSDNWKNGAVKSAASNKRYNDNLKAKREREGLPPPDRLELFREATMASHEYVGDVSHITKQDLDLLNFNANAYKDVAQNQIGMF